MDQARALYAFTTWPSTFFCRNERVPKLAYLYMNWNVHSRFSGFTGDPNAAFSVVLIRNQIAERRLCIRAAEYSGRPVLHLLVGGSGNGGLFPAVPRRSRRLDRPSPHPGHRDSNRRPLTRDKRFYPPGGRQAGRARSPDLTCACGLWRGPLYYADHHRDFIVAIDAHPGVSVVWGASGA